MLAILELNIRRTWMFTLFSKIKSPGQKNRSFFTPGKPALLAGLKV